MQRLNVSPYIDRKNRNPEKAEGTCEWFTGHSLFQKWRDEASALLWVSADPGCGKSVLARYLIDDKFSPNDTRATCYFFFKDEFEDQKTLECALCCVLHQLFLQRPSLLSEEILEDFEEEGDQLFASFDRLWNILVNAASHDFQGELVCILDALDECVDPTRLVVALTRIYGKSKRDTPMKFLVTSRAYFKIQREFQDLKDSHPTIHLSGESQEEVDKISQEINLFINHRIDKLSKRLTANEFRILQEELATVNHRTYLWIYLILPAIEDAVLFSTEDLRAVIRSMPRTVEEAYNAILSKSKDQAKAKRILHIVTAADRPLYLTEMAAILAFQKGKHRSYEDLKRDLLPSDRLEQSIREACGLFVVIQDSQVFLLHQTAREFLVRLPSGLTENHSSSLDWQHSLDPGDSHLVLSEVCIWYLLLENFEKGDLKTDSTTESGQDPFVFLDYAASNWATHYRQARNVAGTDLEQLALRLCDTKSLVCSNWLKVYERNHVLGHELHLDLCHPLLIASYFGLHGLVNLITQKDRNCLRTRSAISKRTALSWSSEKGHDSIVQLLLDQFPKIESIVKYFARALAGLVDRPDRLGKTPLWYAAANGHTKAVQLLLQKGATIDARDDTGLTPLVWALHHGHSDVVALLIEKGAKENLKAGELERIDRRHRTALTRAVLSGNEVVVQLLLEKGAQIEAEDKTGATALLCASHKGHQTIAELLLDRGANIEASDRNGVTSLMWASYQGYEGMTKMLLDRGARIEALSKLGRTALMFALLQDKKTTAKLLLDRGAQAEVFDKNGNTPLLLAAMKGSDDVAKALLDKGANVEASNEIGCTALVLASLHVHEAMVNLLLERGAQVEATNNHGYTALMAASVKGSEAIAKLLLDGGAQMESSNEDGFTPLILATLTGYPAIVTLLLGRGAQIEASDKNGRTALGHALMVGDDVMAKLLIGKGAQREAT
jgi:ankyrin repeat protein